MEKVRSLVGDTISLRKTKLLLQNTYNLSGQDFHQRLVIPFVLLALSDGGYARYLSTLLNWKRELNIDDCWMLKLL